MRSNLIIPPLDEDGNLADDEEVVPRQLDSGKGTQSDPIPLPAGSDEERNASGTKISKHKRTSAGLDEKRDKSATKKKHKRRMNTSAREERGSEERT